MKNKIIKAIEKSKKFFISKIINRKIQFKYILIGIILILTIFISFGKIVKLEKIFLKFNNFNFRKQSENLNSINEKIINNSLILNVEYGKNIFNQFLEKGFSQEEVRQIINEINLYYDLRKLKPGHKFEITFDSEFYYEEKKEKKDSKIKKNNKKNITNNPQDDETKKEPQIIYEKKEKKFIKSLFFKDVLNGIKITINYNDKNQKYETNIQKSVFTKETKLEKIIIKNNLFSDAISKLSSQMIYKILNEYAFSVDFQRDIQKNDSLTVLMEYLIDEDGNKKDEKILYSNLILNKKDNEIFRFKDSFYNKQGKSSSKSLLLSPVDGARISSRFSANRYHPVLGYSRAHLGIDFAAPIGTPIYASGDGVVTFVGWKGGYGKLVSIRHNGEFSTNYGHMSRFAKKTKVGARVSQREVIGYIGMTGLSSGPHLHYELVRGGKKINPRSIRGIASKKLNSKDLNEFNQVVLELEDKIRKSSK